MDNTAETTGRRRDKQPYEPDNEAATKHGANSRRRWQPVADRLEAELLAEKPWLINHARTVKAWARVEAQILLISRWLDANGLLDENGEPRPAGHRLDRLETRAQSLRNDLAETPLAMARLLSTLTETAATTGATGTLEQLRADGAALVDTYYRSMKRVPAMAELPEAGGRDA